MNKKAIGLLIFIIFVGAFLRFFDLNWDQGFHLHPDERFLTMVGVAAKIPSSLPVYLDPKTSPLNPVNLNYAFYVYGILPVTITKILAVLFHFDTYDYFNILGRGIAAFCDVLTIVFVFFFTKDLEEKTNLPSSTKYFSAFLYAIAVFAIQLSHFFAVDIFMNFFMFASVFFSLRYTVTKRFRYLILSPIFLGLAIASKVTALAIFPLIMFFILLPFLKKGRSAFTIYSLTEESLKIILYIVTTYLFVRLADPYMFQSTNLFIPTLNSDFLKSIQQLNMYSSPDVWYPPNVQWMNKLPLIFALQNIVFFGVGIPYFLLILFGMYKSFKKKQSIFLAIFAWVMLMFFYQSIQFAKTMRYFIYLYPFFAIYAAVALSYLFKKFPKSLFIIIPLLLIWPLSFTSIYTKPHSRVAASEWIYQHLPDNSVILSEYWDDGLPLPVRDGTKNFVTKEFPVFDPDSTEKWQTMNSLLAEGNYLILSSNRGWGSIPTVPKKYPQMSKFYANLFAGKLPYKKVAEFTSYPSLRYIGIPVDFPDAWSEEAFTVYDHPVVMIFKKQ